jgi:hypothetical protein
VKRIFGIVFGSVRQIQRQGWYTVYYLFTAKKNENQELRQTVYDLNTSLGPHQRNEELKYRIPGCLPFLQHCHVAKTPNTFCCAVHTHTHTQTHTHKHTQFQRNSNSLTLCGWYSMNYTSTNFNAWWGVVCCLVISIVVVQNGAPAC